MAQVKKARQIWSEIEATHKELKENILPSLHENKKRIEEYSRELFEGTESENSLPEKIAQLESDISNSSYEARDKVGEIIQLHDQFLGGDENSKSLKDKLEKFFSDSEEMFEETNLKREDFDDFYEKVFGNENEEGERVGGLENEISKYESRYKTLFNEIEKLLPGATTAGLAKVFSDKVSEYKRTVGLWTMASFFLLVVVVLKYLLSPIDAETFDEIIIGLLKRLPFIIFMIWIIVFAGNRRAESKKLEESYKHKEVMAKSFIGFKRQIEELESEDTDKVLLKAHMENVLSSINENSAGFLDKSGDKSPVHDVIDAVKGVFKKKVEDSSTLLIKDSE